MRLFAMCFWFATAVYGIALPGGERIRGAALFGEKLYTWGDALRVWDLPRLESRVLAASAFSEGGCVVDLDGNGEPEFVSAEGKGLGLLTIRQGPEWTPKTIDTEIESHDCTQATLFGRKGILMVQRYMQVRFYEPATWAYREIYSFYTASRQTGLVVKDVDGDGLSDIFCGNYWIRSPKSFELPWKLYAINTYHQTPESAMSRFAVLSDGRVAVAQGHMDSSPLRIFERRRDPNLLWKETTVPFELVRPHGIAVLQGKIYVGEDNGSASRVIRFDSKPKVLLRDQPCLEILKYRGRLILAGPTSVRML